jgi:hypothetical protein
LTFASPLLEVRKAITEAWMGCEVKMASRVGVKVQMAITTIVVMVAA